MVSIGFFYLWEIVKYHCLSPHPAFGHPLPRRGEGFLLSFLCGTGEIAPFEGNTRKLITCEPFAKLFRSWFDRLTTNGISASYLINPFALSLSKGVLQKARAVTDNVNAAHRYLKKRSNDIMFREEVARVQALQERIVKLRGSL